MESNKPVTGLLRWQVIERLSTLVVLAVGLILAYRLIVPPAAFTETLPPAIPLPAEPLSFSGAPTEGNQDAPAGLTIFSDFDCPYCAVFAQGTWPQVRRAYVLTDKLIVAFRHVPLESIHPQSFLAATYAECAAKQDFFWQTHDVLFRKPDRERVIREGSRTLAAAIAPAVLNLERFNACAGGDGATRVREDMALATKLSIRSTPVFLLGKRRPDGAVVVSAVLRGAKSFPDFQQAIDSVLSSSVQR